MSTRNRLINEKIEIEKSACAIAQLPVILTIQWVWGSVFFLFVGHYGKLPILTATGILFCSSISGSIYKNFRFLSPLPLTSRQKLLSIEGFVIFLGIFWGVCVLIFLPRTNPTVSQLLTLGCMSFAMMTAHVMYAMPIATVLCTSIIFASSLLLSISLSTSGEIIFWVMIALMTLGTYWIILENERKFLISVNASAERNLFSHASEVAEKMQNQFLENISHEIKTPLTAIVGYANMLLSAKQQMSSTQKEFLDNLNISAAFLSNVIEKILDLSKLNAGQLPLYESVVDIHMLLERITLSIREKAEEKGLAVFLEIDGDIPRLCVGDAERIEQIISHLLSNALKFTEIGSVRIKACCLQPPSVISEKKMLRISVSDTGIGIENSKQSSIFRSFYQGDGSTSRKYGGTGLSLTTSRMLAHLMGGDLEFESDVQRGSTFKFWLPIKNIHHESVNERKNKTVSIEELDAALTILIVDDDTYIRHYLSILFFNDGWGVDLCENGWTAIEKCSKVKYSLILMDIQMPIMTGIEASKKIWLQKVNQNTSILVLTGYLSVDRIAELRLAGLQEYLAKPTSSEVLLENAHRLANKPRLSNSRLA